MFRILGLALIASLVSSPVLAEEENGLANGRPSVGVWGGEEVDVSYEASRARLHAAGYSDVQQVDGDALRLKALDRQGTPVLLSINPQDGEIESAAHVNVNTAAK
ncbi:MAG: hypothetical protein AAF637_20405 [Pseudomonadota bacterium]